MAIHETYAKRQKRLRGEFNDVYQYEDIPRRLRFQILKIYENLFTLRDRVMNPVYANVKELIENEIGDNLPHDVFAISQYSEKNYETQVLFSYVENYCDTDGFLSVLEVVIDRVDKYSKRGTLSVDIDSLIDEINTRFRESAVGYQIDKNSLHIIKIESEFIQSEVMLPILTALNSEPMYAGSQNEFMTAHDHYRHGRYRDAISSCGNSFESMLKAIHEKRGWDYEKGKATASPLIDSCSANGLFPEWQKMQHKEINNIFKSIIKTGVPKVRNEKGSHGQGPEVIEIPEHLASYMIHLTATNLLFLANAEKALG
ncbi:STM4504/CBY_0614 family protein [Aeromonas sp. 55A]|uniref:STM4504/CBY_0614 family protein n=1 Tax=Aeromonas sp. 55A TaxID=3452720 RepID=UPI0038DFD545